MTARPITPDDLWRLSRVGSPTPTPDGTFAIVPITTYDVEDNRGKTRLHTLTRTGDLTPLTGETTSDSSPAISADGTRVAFVRSVPGSDDPAQVHVMRLDGGEAERVTDLPLGASGPRWLPDGSGLIVLASVIKGHLDVPATAAEVEARKDRTVEARVTEDRIYRYWDHWLTGGEVHHVFSVPLDGGEAIDLTPTLVRRIDFEEAEDSLAVSPDGTEIAFHLYPAEVSDDESPVRVVRLAIDGGEPREIWPDGPPLQVRPRYSPDGTRLVFGIADDWPGFYASQIRLVSLDLASGERTLLTEDWDRSCDGWEFIDDATIALVAHDEARQHLFTVPAAGGTPTPIAKGGWLTAPAPADGEVWTTYQDLSTPAEAAVVLPGSGTEMLSEVNAEIMSEITLGEVEDVRFTGANGDEVQMFVVYPPGFDSSRQWPLVHDIHGGPHGVTGDLWHYRWNPQVFASTGSVVAGVNFHGSTGWGNDFARSIQGEWGDMPAADIMAATDTLVDRGFIDPVRMVIAGGSYGGYLVSWLIAGTDRFAAAICHAGVNDLLAQYASDATMGRAQAFGGNAWDGLDAVQRWSPTDHSDAMVTPTLVIHGERDYRVPIGQGLELYGILKAKGVEARLVYFPDEGHWILKPQNSLLWHEEFLGWVERFAGGGGTSG
ncbi:S9 family peptidase [bacterium]|nr:S9 family peptidase [bacterium]